MTRQRQCRICKDIYTPYRPLQRVCGVTCAIALGKQKAARKALRTYREDSKTLTQHKKDTSFLMHKYIRLRDMRRPCISCGQSPYQGQRHASHFRPRSTAAQLSYNFLNVWASCAQCNGSKSGNLGPYRVALTKILTPSQLLAIEHNNERAEFTVEYLKRLQGILKRRIKYYRKLRA